MKKSICEQWLPENGEAVSNFSMFIRQLNVAPGVRDEQMVTDIGLPTE